jgi:hypothetical protein
MSTTPLWTIAEVARALGLSGEFPDTPIDFVTQDSRLVKPGCLFVALSGTPSGGFISSFASARDGWDFADKAQAAGAVAMIVPHRIDGVSVPQLIVKDTLIDGLWTLGARGAGALQGPGDRPDRQRRQDQHQGIPRRVSCRLCQPEQFQQFLGRAADAVQCQPDASVWVVEMGMNQSGEIARLSELTKPTVALVVNVQPVHLEKLGSLEAIRREKVSIAQGLPKDGVLVLPDDVEAPEWNGKVVRFGEASEVRELKHSAEGESWNVTADCERQANRIRPDARCAASAAECAGRAGVHPCRRARTRGAGERARPCRHHDRPRRRAGGPWRHRDRRQFQRQSGQHGGRARQPEGAAGEGRPAHRHSRRHAGIGRDAPAYHEKLAKTWPESTASTASAR